MINSDLVGLGSVYTLGYQKYCTTSKEEKWCMNNGKLLLCKLIVTLSGEWEGVGSKTTTNQNLNLF